MGSQSDAVTRYRQSPKGKATRQARERKNRANNPEKARAKDRDYAKANPGFIRAKNFRGRYKISVAKWLNMFASQNECCAICKSKTPGSKHWATDHDHETGRIRGILCHRCNLCLGWLGDTGAVVASRIVSIRTYLDEPRIRDENGRLVMWVPKAMQ